MTGAVRGSARAASPPASGWRCATAPVGRCRRSIRRTESPRAGSGRDASAGRRAAASNLRIEIYINLNSATTKAPGWGGRRPLAVHSVVASGADRARAGRPLAPLPGGGDRAAAPAARRRGRSAWGAVRGAARAVLLGQRRAGLRPAGRGRALSRLLSPGARGRGQPPRPGRAASLRAPRGARRPGDLRGGPGVCLRAGDLRPRPGRFPLYAAGHPGDGAAGPPPAGSHRPAPGPGPAAPSPGCPAAYRGKRPGRGRRSPARRQTPGPPRRSPGRRAPRGARRDAARPGRGGCPRPRAPGESRRDSARPRPAGRSPARRWPSRTARAAPRTAPHAERPRRRAAGAAARSPPPGSGASGRPARARSAPDATTECTASGRRPPHPGALVVALFRFIYISIRKLLAAARRPADASRPDPARGDSVLLMERRHLPTGAVAQRQPDAGGDAARAEPRTAPVILVVDDDPSIRVMLRDLLTLEGYHVELAADGAAARARLERGGIDLLVLDLMLPDIDGVRLCEQARALEGDAYLPIIMLTARAGREQRLAGFAAGADDYVAKPFDVDEMLARVRVWVRTSQRLQVRARRARAREAAVLRSSEARFRAFMDNSPTVCFIKDADGRYVYANAGWQRAFQHAPSDVQGKTTAELWPPEVAERFREHDRSVLAAGSATTGTCTLAGVDGTPREWWCCKFPFHDAQGQAFLGGIALDMTERRQLEDQLRQAQKMEAIGLLAGGIAHDFNNVLMAVTGFSELALARLTPEDPLRVLIDEIARASERAAVLTRQLLVFSRQEV